MHSNAADIEDVKVWDDKRLAEPHHQADKSERVRRMFDAIAPTYERINSLFSFGRDRAWRRELVRLADVRPHDRVLDIACGTGDVVRAFERYSGPASVTGLDFSASMLAHAKTRGGDICEWCQADALSLPFADNSFDVVSCAFGVRNFQNLDRGLEQMFRVLRPRGRAVILEFSRPQNRAIRAIHEFYAGTLMPRAAGLISRDSTGAYRYLPRSVVSFCGPEQMRDALVRAGFTDPTAHRLTFGVVHVYRAIRKDQEIGSQP